MEENLTMNKEQENNLNEDIKNFNNKKRNPKSKREMLEIFQKIMWGKITSEGIKYFKKRTIDELILLQLKCTEKGVGGEVKIDRALAYLGNEINKRIQRRSMCIAVIVAFIVGLIPVAWDIINIFIPQCFPSP